MPTLAASKFCYIVPLGACLFQLLSIPIPVSRNPPSRASCVVGDCFATSNKCHWHYNRPGRDGNSIRLFSKETLEACIWTGVLQRFEERPTSLCVGQGKLAKLKAPRFKAMWNLDHPVELGEALFCESASPQHFIQRLLSLSLSLSYLEFIIPETCPF